MSINRAHRFLAFNDRWSKTIDGAYTLSIAIAVTGGLFGLWPMKWAVWTVVGGLLVLIAGTVLAYRWAKRPDRP